MNEDKIISALIGLAGACSNNPKTANTDTLILKALAFPSICPEYDDQMLQKLIDDIHSEKFAIAPNCAVCQTPCGNTSDYDMRRIYESEIKIREWKLQILAKLRTLAADICRSLGSGTIPLEYSDFFHKALLYVSYDMEETALLALLEEAEQIGYRLKPEERIDDKENHKD